jgi:regulator of protease activity HflC (stomatin/prohibitin superfamily)
MVTFFWIVVAIVVLLIVLRQINQYERGVLFTMGRYTGMLNPGWRIVIPIFQTMRKVDVRIKAVDVPDQRAITKDNVVVTVNAVIYYNIIDAHKAIIEVENFYYAVLQLAQTTMRNVVGEVELDELLSQRELISDKIRTIVEKSSDAWGVQVDNVELKDVSLPEEMERTIGKQAEAEREKRAVIIQAQGEVLAAENMAKAATILSAAPGALHLRTLQTIDDVSSDASNTIIFVTPVEVLKALEGFAKKGPHE